MPIQVGIARAVALLGSDHEVVEHERARCRGGALCGEEPRSVGGEGQRQATFARWRRELRARAQRAHHEHAGPVGAREGRPGPDRSGRSRTRPGSRWDRLRARTRMPGCSRRPEVGCRARARRSRPGLPCRDRLRTRSAAGPRLRWPDEAGCAERDDRCREHARRPGPTHQANGPAGRSLIKMAQRGSLGSPFRAHHVCCRQDPVTRPQLVAEACRHRHVLSFCYNEPLGPSGSP
jgi:hypothetical protein